MPSLSRDLLLSRLIEKRAPQKAPLRLPLTQTELSAPLYHPDNFSPQEADLTLQSTAPPLGQRIVITGRILDEADRPIPHTLVEIWQANAAGRYAHPKDTHQAPLDPHFYGAGRCLTDAEGRYTFITIKPGPYPWNSRTNSWRPAHIHFSLFGPSYLSRLVTQMYFPDDPLLPYDPIYHSISDPQARQRLIAHLNLDLSIPRWALAFEWDIVLRGGHQTPFPH